MQEQEIHRSEPSPTSPHTIPVDLNRDEFITFYTVMNRLGSTTARRLQIFLLLMLLAMNTYPLFMGVMAGEPMDLARLLYSGILALLCIGWYLWLPARAKRVAARSYDEACASGKVFFGQVMLYPDRVVKQGEGGTTTLYKEQGLVAIERPDMVIFSAPGQPSIILGAAYVTSADLPALRRVLQALPSQQRLCMGTFVPQATRHISAQPAAQWAQDEDTLRFAVCLTHEETIKYVSQRSVQRFVHQLPGISIVATVLAVALVVIGGWLAGIIGWLTVIGAAFGILVGWPRWRAVHTTEQEVGTDMVSIREEGLSVQTASGRQTYRYRWAQIAHIVERPWCVEFSAGGQTFVLPKRCIVDWETFQAFVDAHWPTSGRSST